MSMPTVCPSTTWSGVTTTVGPSARAGAPVIEDAVATVEPLLRRAADHEVRTDAPLDDVLATILRLVDVE